MSSDPLLTRFFFLRALRYRNYRLFFSGQSISLIGTWMTRIATSWLVYRLTGSAWLLGIVGFAGQFPTFLLAPLAGVWVDRMDRHKILVVTQVLAMLQSFALAILTLGNWIVVWEIVALGAFQGLINAFDMPGRQAFVIEMVEKKEDLGNAIALNSSMVNMARLIGPSLAGMVIAVAGEGYCFLIDGISYIAVILSLVMMTTTPRRSARREEKGLLSDLAEGWRYVAASRPIRAVLLLLALVSLVGMPYTVLMPIFAGEVLHGGPHTLGFLMGATGTGALLGAIVLATRKSVLGLGRLVAVAAACFGGGLIAFSASRSFPLSLALLFITGYGMMTQMASTNTILQTIVKDHQRGRVMSYYAMAFVGMAPFGSILAGTMASSLGAPHTLLIGGLCCCVGAVLFAFRLPQLREAVRPIYVELGILPEVATGLQAAAELRTPPEV